MHLEITAKIWKYQLADILSVVLECCGMYFESPLRKLAHDKLY